MLHKFSIWLLPLALSLPTSVAADWYALLYGKESSMCKAAVAELNRNAADKHYRVFQSPPFASPTWRKIEYANKTGDRLTKWYGHLADIDIDNDGTIDRVLRYYTYPNRTVAENFLFLDEQELVDNRTAVVEFSTYPHRSKIVSSAPYKVDERLLREDNPEISIFRGSTFHMGSLSLEIFSYSNVSYVVLKKMYPDKPNPNSSWLIVGRYTNEPISESLEYRSDKVVPSCYFRRVFDQ